MTLWLLLVRADGGYDSFTASVDRIEHVGVGVTGLVELPRQVVREVRSPRGIRRQELTPEYTYVSPNYVSFALPKAHFEGRQVRTVHPNAVRRCAAKPEHCVHPLPAELAVDADVSAYAQVRRDGSWRLRAATDEGVQWLPMALPGSLGDADPSVLRRFPDAFDVVSTSAFHVVVHNRELNVVVDDAVAARLPLSHPVVGVVGAARAPPSEMDCDSEAVLDRAFSPDEPLARADVDCLEGLVRTEPKEHRFASLALVIQAVRNGHDDEVVRLIERHLEEIDVDWRMVEQLHDLAQTGHAEATVLARRFEEAGDAERENERVLVETLNRMGARIPLDDKILRWMERADQRSPDDIDVGNYEAVHATLRRWQVLDRHADILKLVDRVLEYGEDAWQGDVAIVRRAFLGRVRARSEEALGK